MTTTKEIEPINLKLVNTELASHSLERKGLVVSRLDSDGEVRWGLTEKGIEWVKQGSLAPARRRRSMRSR